MRAAKTEGKWMELADDVWGLIFSLLRPDIEHSSYELEKDLGVFYALRTVCKKFADVFEQTPQLFSTLVLQSSLGSSSLPGMYRWIQRHCNAVETLVSSSGSPWLEAALAALEVHSPPGKRAPLTTVHLEYMPQAAIFLLSRFTSITSCVLMNDHPDQPPLSLRAFENLPCLTSLWLTDGSFLDADAPLHVSSLSLLRCHASYSWGCDSVSPLVALELNDSRLSGFPSQGLSVCSKLQSLQCMQSCIFDGQGNEVMQFQEGKPVNVSALTALTQLHVWFRNDRNKLNIVHDHDLGWLEGLSALRDFFCDFKALRVTLPISLSCMNQLSSLYLRNDSSHGSIWFSVNWSGLSALTTLSVIGVSMFHLGWPLSDLADIRTLKHVVLSVVGEHVHHEYNTAKAVEQLAARLRAERPDVSYVNVYENAVQRS